MHTNETPEDPKPIIYSCSGCSDAGEFADRVARELNRRGVGQMSCLAGIGGRVKPLMIKAQKAQRIIVVDGCPLNCARHTLLGAGFNQFQHVELHKLGHRKGSCPVTEERVSEATVATENLIHCAQENFSGNDADLKIDGPHLYPKEQPQRVTIPGVSELV